MFAKETHPAHSARVIIVMGSKLSNTLIIFGCLLMLLGLCFLPAGLSNKDQSILGAGICAISFGAMWISGGIYIKARTLQSVAGSGATNAQPQVVRGGCDLCGTDSPVIHCRVHQIHICGECVARHYDFRSCVYVPSTRRTTPAKPLSRAARSGR